MQAEYGWTDDQVLDLTLRRLRQVVEAIRYRRKITDMRTQHYIEAGVKQIGFTVLASGMISGEAKTTLMDVLNDFSLSGRSVVSNEPDEKAEADMDEDELRELWQRRHMERVQPGSFERAAAVMPQWRVEAPRE